MFMIHPVGFKMPEKDTMLGFKVSEEGLSFKAIIDPRTAAAKNIIGFEAYKDAYYQPVADGDNWESVRRAIVAKLAEHDLHCGLTDDYTILAADETEATLIRLTFPGAAVEVRR